MAKETTVDPGTVGSNLAATTLADIESKYTSNIQPDIIKGWNDRRLANNVELTSLVPFVQLIGVFNPTEYEKMFGTEGALSRKPVYFTAESGPDIASNQFISDYKEEQGFGEASTDEEGKTDDPWADIKADLVDRFIDLFVFPSAEYLESLDGGEEKSVLHMTPIDGILMAEYKSQAKDAQFNKEGEFTGIDSTGGIGITDLQVDYGKSNALGSRKLNMRITVNNPSMLDEKPEYTKLSTMQGEFIILYGWSNPQIIEGFDATPPPILLPSTAHPGERKMMIIGLDNMNTGGYWSAVKLNVVSYDFAFNEMGQLEINVGFMDKTSMMMNSMRVGAIAREFKNLMSRGDFDPTTSASLPVPDLTQMTTTLANGTQVPLADLIANEQDAMSGKSGSTPTGAAPPTLEDLYERRAVSFTQAFDSAGDSGQVTYSTNKGEYNQESYWAQVKKRERRGFPYGGIGIRSYEKVTVRRRREDDPSVAVNTEEGTDDVDDTADGENVTEEITGYRVKVVYYYLGWVLEAMRLSLIDQNRSRIREGDTSFNPKFKYLKNESTSQLKSAFQQKVSQTERRGSTNEQIQNAIIRLKEKCMPPFLMREGDIPGGADIKWDDNEDGLRPQDLEHSPCAGQVIAEGLQRDKTAPTAPFQAIADKIFPIPEGVPDTILPMRGHRVLIDPGSDAYAHIEDLTPSDRRQPSFWVFKPDWFKRDVIIEDPGMLPPELQINLEVVEEEGDRAEAEGAGSRNIEVIPAGGSPEGYDPFNPTTYKAAERGGRFFYKVVRSTFEWGIGTKATRGEQIFIMEVDQFRNSDTEIWQLTQRKWHSLYVQYLGNYFEQLIRNRVAELEKEGKTVKDIYNEPLDLDFLTGRVFDCMKVAHNSRVRDNSRDRWTTNSTPYRWVPATWSNVQKYFPADEELKGSITKTDRELTNTITALAEERITQTDILQTITEKLNINNHIKREIEELTGGKYEIGRDAAENAILINFKNWKHIGQGELITDPGGKHYEQTPLYEDNVGVPQVKLEWMIWKKYRIPTDNFFRYPSHMNGENLQSKWISRNFAAGIDQSKLLQDEVETAEALVNENLPIINENDRVLKGYNDKYLDVLENIDALENQQNILTTRLTRYSKYITENETGQTELSPYDDTSEFDDPLEVDMGRDKPMVLNTRVSQQWYSRFSVVRPDDQREGFNRYRGTGDNWINGVTDVTNYGPKEAGGTKHYRRSSERAFQFDRARRGNPIVGFPRIILDRTHVAPKRPPDEDVPRSATHWPSNTPRPRLREAAAAVAGGAPTWRDFGVAGEPNSDGRNAFGFLPGPRVINERGTNIGGDHFADYNDFLELFGLTAPMKITGRWPKPSPAGVDVDAGQVIDDYYYIIDDANNIIRMADPEYSAEEELEGTFLQTGWYLGYGGKPVYLYPSVATAVQINPETNEWIAQGNKTGQTMNNVTALDNMNRTSENSRDDRYYGAHYRIGPNQHNINLTLDEKRALVLPTGDSTWDAPSPKNGDGPASPVQSYQGHRGGTKGPGGGMWSLSWEIPSLGASYNGVPTDGPMYKDLTDKGEVKRRSQPYTNPSWPYGTGYYIARNPGGEGYPTSSTKKVPGSWQTPKHGDESEHFVRIGDLLNRLPNHGFFTTVNNDNHSPSTISSDGNIVNGKELNIDFVKFIIENVYAPLGQNRRIAIRGNGDGRPRGSLVVSRNTHLRNRLNDTTYGHLFRPLDDEEDNLSDSGGISFTDFGLKDVESVADMPIRRDVVDNLMNKNNVNMSLAQFIQELIHPNAIGINTGNIHVSIRQKAAGNFEVFQATKNWRAKADEVDEEHLEKLFLHKYPENHFLVDYKHQDSLIENLDMSSKFDPAIALTFERGAQAFAGNPTAIVKFLAYGTVADDLKNFLDREDKVNNTDLYTNVFSSVGVGASGPAAKIVIAQNAFFDTPKDNGKKIVSDSVMTRFLMQRPERMNKLNAMLQATPGSDFATQLLSHYMRKCTITIHGTTNLTPFNSINVSGVLPNLEGLYLITSVRESIQTQNFQTIIEAILLRPRKIESMEGHDYSMG